MVVHPYLFTEAMILALNYVDLPLKIHSLITPSLRENYFEERSAYEGRQCPETSCSIGNTVNAFITIFIIRPHIEKHFQNT